MFSIRGLSVWTVWLAAAGSVFSPYSVAALSDVCLPLGPAVISIPFSSSLVVQRDVPVGGVLASVEVKTPIRCNNRFFPTGGYAQYFKSSSNAAVGVSRGAFRTSNSGIGLRWTLSAPTGNYSFSSTDLNSTSPMAGVAFPYLGGDKYYALQHTFELIKLGDVAGGSFRFPDFSVMSSPDSVLGGLYDKKLNTFTFPQVNVAVSSCFVMENSILVKMGRVDANSFRGPGTAVQEKSFSIDLRCDAGARVNLTLDSTHQVGGYPGTIRLASSAQSAIGVGIQVLNASMANHTPMLLGQPQMMGLASGGINSLKLAARYIQVANKVSGGKADGTLTFVLSYL
ncbi:MULTISPECIES: fimbrial protein [Pseudomonas]|uniref:fimbrial protein n=1 Tax=Pseudomonas TaxID=286 RepID=UPI0023667DE2|nr:MULTISPECIES: fimbrial protein [Pseudomonas]WDG52899.1 fimbrial protein [Pseudomonas chlororaphis]WDH50920.1 fimbrial protein [Pseudomonas chlororaphis]WDH86079.1 fimbrial protein [Pseudomonas chlororaphis]WPO48244.1 fimbrial protein [Pseudomonas sp. S1Bt23]